MIKQKKLFLFLSFLLCLNATSYSAASAVLDISTSSSETIEVFVETDAEFIFEIQVPRQDLKMESAISEAGDQNEYMKISLPGWSSTAQPGSPSLPMLTKTIGVPFGSKVSLQVIPGDAFTQVLDKFVLPVVTQKTDWVSSFVTRDEPMLPDVSYQLLEDAALYKSANTYPGKLAELTSDGNIRGQRVVGIAIYPVQFNPATKELTTYESIFVKVTFEGGQGTQFSSFTQESNFYEDLFKEQILNYESARGWRQEITPLSVDSSTGISSLTLPWTPPDLSWKVRVREDGIYRLTYEELAAEELPVDELDPSELQLFNLGTEVAIHVEDAGDSSFDPGDYILFYGQKPASKYALDNVYWLTYGKAAGLRMVVRDGTPGVGQTPDKFSLTQHIETNNMYYSDIPGEEQFERWMWDYVSSTPSRIFSTNFVLTAPYDSGSVMTIAMFSINQSPTIDPDHLVSITVNDTQVGEYQWDGITWFYPEISIPEGLLMDGSNTLKVTALNPPEYNYIYIDWFKFDYPSYFITENDQLAFRYNDPGPWNYQIDGFTNQAIRAFDISNSTFPVFIEGVTTIASDLGYAAQFQDSIAEGSDYLVVADTAILDEESIDYDTPSNLQSTTNGADHIIITHHTFIDQANILREFRASQGMRAISVDVQDIYDEFNYGLTDVKAIKDFLAYTATSWVNPDPSFVVLMGDGHYDPKDYDGYGRPNYIPAYLAPVDPSIIETAADDRYVMLTEGDLLPDMMLGRLAVNNTTEAAAIVSKIIAYEQSPTEGNWQEQVLMIADNADDAGNFSLVSDDLIDCCLPEPFMAEKIYYGITHTNTTDPTAGQAILAGINAGKLIVNYIGHGSATRWGTSTEGMFSTGDVAGLTNTGKLPIMLPMTCMDGYYIYNFSSLESMAEVITKADNKGAIASWSATGYGTTYGHDFLDKGFFEAVFLGGNGEITLGEATNAGKLNLWASGTNLDLMDTYLLFGDPATRVALRFNAVDDSYTTNQGSTLTASSEEGVLINDIHPENAALTAVLVDPVKNGNLEFSANGSFSYTPNMGFVGPDSFTYQAYDGTSYTNIATVSISVTPFNTPPVAFDQSVSTLINTPLDITLTAEDDGGTGPTALINSRQLQTLSSSLIFNIEKEPDHGSLVGEEGSAYQTYKPEPDFIGLDSFTFTAFDGEKYSNIATVSITVIADNQRPTDITLSNNSLTENEPVNSVVGVLSSADPDVGDEHSYTLVSGSGSEDNAAFNILENSLRTSIVFDYEAKSSYSIRVRSTDSGELFTEKAFTILVIQKGDKLNIYLPLILK